MTKCANFEHLLGRPSLLNELDTDSHAIHGQDDEAARKWEEFQQQNGRSQKENHRVV